MTTLIAFPSTTSALTTDQVKNLEATATRNQRRGASGHQTHQQILAITNTKTLTPTEKINELTALGASLRKHADIAYLQTHRAQRFIKLNKRIQRI